MEHAVDSVDSTPLLAGSETGSAKLRAAVSECKLQDKCFLAGGAAQSSQGYRKIQRKLMIACILCFIFMAIEIVGGYIAKSVAIMSDAAHMLSDVSAFLVSIFATWAATQPSSWHYSFGYHRAEILGALVSVLTIWAVTGALVFEAFQRTINPVRVDGKLMFIIASAGVVFNIFIALTLGVHAHLGHSHGSEGCSGHDHEHGQEHGHDHSSGGHKHSHSKCSHSHSDSLSNGQHQHGHGSSSAVKQPGSSGHQDKEHDQYDRQHDHAHHQRSDSSCSSHSSGGSHYPSQSDDEEHHHSHSNSSSSNTAGTSAAAVAIPLPLRDSVVINLPISPAKLGGCGQQGHAVSCCCTIRRTGSREIEVRYELPASNPSPAGARGRGHSHSHSGHDQGEGNLGSINLRSAVLHVIGDLLQSVGVAIAGAMIWLHQDDPRWYLADPICTFVFSIAVLLTTKTVLRDIIHVLMERTPQHMDIPAMSQVMLGMEGIRDVHDLHIWNISTSMKPVLTAHVHIGPEADPTTVLQQLEQYVRGIGIDHSTIQICNPQRSLDGQLAAALDI